MPPSRYTAHVLAVTTILLSRSAFGDPLDGRVRGLHDALDSYGGFSQSIPIEVPAHRSLEPRLSLRYHSSAPNGLTGVGWQLAGLSSITTRPPERAVDLQVYMLDDQELVSCLTGNSSPSCQAGGGFFTRDESWSRIQRPSPDTWVVTHPNGTTATYAQRAGARYERWNVTELRDTLGNFVRYDWSCPADDAVSRCYPTQVQSNPITIDGATTHQFTVRFYYEDRPEPAAYRQTWPGDQTPPRYLRRLATVLVMMHGRNLRAYKLNYDPSRVSGNSLLTSVSQLGTDVVLDAAGQVTGGQTLSTRAFAYNDTLPATPRVWQISEAHQLPDDQVLFPDEGLRVVDLNGDGLQDLLRLSNALRAAWLNHGGVWERADAYAYVNTPVALSFLTGESQHHGNPPIYLTLADIDGDGRADLIQLPTASWVTGFGVHYSRPPGFWSYQNHPEVIPDHYRPHDYFIDLNGDARADLLRLGVGTAYLNYYSDGTVGQWVRASHLAAGLPDSNLEGLVFADLNGDGLTDILQSTCTGSGPYKGAWISTGYGFVAAPEFAPPTCFYPDEGAKVFDVNGDGRADLVKSNTYQECEPGRLCSTFRDRWVRLNDGFGWRLLPASTKYIFDDFFRTDYQGNTHYYPFDINGDGSVDLVRSRRVNGAASHTTYLNTMAHPDVMLSATNGLGGLV